MLRVSAQEDPVTEDHHQVSKHLVCLFDRHLIGIVPEPRHTPLGGLKRLGTVMNRRKSIVASPSGSFSLDKKHRTPFVPFRKGDSSREMQIPESPTSSPPQDQLSGSHIPQDSISTEPEYARGPSESNARGDFDAISPAPEANVAATNGTNGTLLGDHPGAEVNVASSPVRIKDMLVPATNLIIFAAADRFGGLLRTTTNYR